MGSILPLITGSAGAVVVLALGCWLFLTGKLHSEAEFSKLARENDDLKGALESERKAVDEAARTGTITNQLISALIQISTQKEGDDRRTDRERRAAGDGSGLIRERPDR